MKNVLDAAERKNLKLFSGIRRQIIQFAVKTYTGAETLVMVYHIIFWDGIT